MQLFSARCEDVEEGDYVRCVKRNHSFRQDTVGDLLIYVTDPRHWDNKIEAIAHKAKAFELHFNPNYAILLKWKPDTIINVLKIMYMKVERLVLLDSVFCLPCALRKLPGAYAMTASKSCYLIISTQRKTSTMYFTTFTTLIISA